MLWNGYWHFSIWNIIPTKKNKKMLDKDARNITAKDLAKFDCVLMLAGVSNDPFGNLDPKLIYDPTVKYALDIAKLCKKLNIKYIFPSSCSVYGISQYVFK